MLLDIINMFLTSLVTIGFYKFLHTSKKRVSIDTTCATILNSICQPTSNCAGFDD